MKKNTRTPKNEQLIYVKLEYAELVQAKRNMLSLEMSLLKIAKTIGRHRFLRMEELKRKQVLQKNMRDTNTKIKNLQITLPKLKIPKILKKESGHREKETQDLTMKGTRYIPSDYNIEAQLQEIQNRLDELQK